MPTFSRSLEKALHRALSFAAERRQEYATLEHLLLSLTEDKDAVSVLRACGVDLEELRDDLTEETERKLASDHRELLQQGFLFRREAVNAGG